MHYRFSQLTNSIKAVTDQFSALVPQGLKATALKKSSPLFWPDKVSKGEGDMFRAAAQVAGRRAMSSVPTHVSEVAEGEMLSLIGPSGKYMIGVSGKLVPKLPKGTKVGNLVMGDYGLYCPKMKAAQQYMQSKPDVPVYMRGKYDTAVMTVVYALVGISLGITVWNAGSLLGGKPLWPVEQKKKT